MSQITHAFPRPEGKKFVGFSLADAMAVARLVDKLHESGTLAGMELYQIHAVVEPEMGKWISPCALKTLLDSMQDRPWKQKEPRPKREPKPKPVSAVAESDVRRAFELLAEIGGVLNVIKECVGNHQIQVGNLESAVGAICSREVSRNQSLDSLSSCVRELERQAAVDSELNVEKFAILLARIEKVENEVLLPNRVSGRKT